MNTYQSPSPQLTPTPPRRPVSCLFSTILFLTGLLSITLFLTALYALFTSPIILPGTTTMGLSLSGQTREQAATTLSLGWQRQTIRITHADYITLTTPSALGLTLDLTTTLDLAYAHGRHLPLQVTTPVTPAFHLDKQQATTYLTNIAPHVAQPAQPGQIQIRAGHATALAAQPGLTLDITATLKYLQMNPETILAQGHLPLQFSAQPPPPIPTPATLTALNQWLNHTLTLTLHDPLHNHTLTTTIPATQWGDWISLTVTTHQVSWHLDSQRIPTSIFPQLDPGHTLDYAPLTHEIGAALEQQQANITARIYHQPQQHTIAAGETFTSLGYQYGLPYPWIQAANPAVADNLFPGQTITIPSPDDLLPLPIPAHKRIVVSLADQRVRVYDQQQLLWDWPASTGITTSPTAPGIFQIQSHQETAYAGNWDLWMPYFMGVYQPIPQTDFMNGFHGFPTRNGRDLLWQANLGAPVTFGCILLDNEAIKTLYDWAPLGTLVIIEPG